MISTSVTRMKSGFRVVRALAARQALRPPVGTEGNDVSQFPECIRLHPLSGNGRVGPRCSRRVLERRNSFALSATVPRLGGLTMCILALLIGSAPQANAAFMAATPVTGTGSTIASLDLTRGWQFTASDYVEVTHLGLFDHASNGIASSGIGLYQEGVTSPLLTTTITTANSSLDGSVFSTSTGSGSFRFTQLGVSEANVLAPGTYRIAADQNSNYYLSSLASVSSANGIAYQSLALAFSTSLAYPDLLFSGHSLGVNFQFVRPDHSASLADGATIDLGGVVEGATLQGVGNLEISSVGDAGSHLWLHGATFGDSRFSLSAGDANSVLTAGASGTEAFNFGFDATGLTPGLYSTIVNFATNMGDYSYTLQATVDAAPSPVPEPSSLALMGLGILGLAGRRVRRRRSAAAASTAE